MPLERRENETRSAFVSRCMETETSIPTEGNQRVAACQSMWRRAVAKDLRKALSFEEATDVLRLRVAVARVSSDFHHLVAALEATLDSIVNEGNDVANRTRIAVDDFARAVATAAQDVTSGALKSAAGGSVLKNEDERLVFGVFNLPSVHGELEVDAQDDVIEPEVLERAMYDFVLNARVASEAHDRVGVGDLVEAMVITPAKEAAITELLKAHGVEDPQFDLGAVVAWGGFHVTDDEVWQAVKDGRYVSFSIGGTATSEAA